MTYFGITPSGVQVSLPCPVQVHLNQSEDAPADEFTGVFPMEKSPGNLTGIRIYDGNETLCFNGIVDEQKESCAVEITLTLIARSQAALLLDNEAIPQTYSMPSLTTIFTRHVRPYGFSSFTGNAKTFTGEFAVTKGMSEWQVAADFCTRFLNVAPRISGDVFDASGERPQGEIRFDNAGGISYSALTVENKYCSLFSELLAQSANGAYSASLRDDTAAALGIQRRRCLTVGQNSGSILGTARQKAFNVKVTCPGEIPAKILQNASVRDEILGETGGLYVSEIDYTLNTSGEITRFALRRLE